MVCVLFVITEVFAILEQVAVCPPLLQCLPHHALSLSNTFITREYNKIITARYFNKDTVLARMKINPHQTCADDLIHRDIKAAVVLAENYNYVILIFTFRIKYLKKLIYVKKKQ